MKEYTASVEKYARAASAYRTALLRSNEDRRRHLLGEGHAVMRYAEAKIQRDEALKLLATRVEASRLDEAQAPLRAMSERVQRLEDAATAVLEYLNEINSGDEDESVTELRAALEEKP